MVLKCHICEGDIDISEKAKGGDRITCTNCFAQLGLYKVKGKFVLGCALCKNLNFDPASCGDCERRNEKRSLIEEGRL